jgi:hypothetical protein
VRERGAVFKLDEPVSELFGRMREVSKKVLATLDPHPHYLMVSPEFELRNFANFAAKRYTEMQNPQRLNK